MRVRLKTCVAMAVGVMAVIQMGATFLWIDGFELQTLQTRAAMRTLTQNAANQMPSAGIESTLNRLLQMAHDQCWFSFLMGFSFLVCSLILGRRIPLEREGSRTHPPS